MPADTPAERDPKRRSRRVLVVDDDEDALALLSQRLRNAGHEVQAATDADLALEAVDEFRPEVAVIDIDLPSMSGYELAEQIRARLRCRLLALSGFRASAAPHDTLVTSFDAHFVKPVQLSVLLHAIDSDQ